MTNKEIKKEDLTKIEETKEILTDEQVDELVDYLGGQVSDKSAMLRDMQKKAESEEESYPYRVLNRGELKKGQASVKVNTQTGEHVILGPADGAGVDANIEDYSDKNILETVKEETINEGLKEFGLNEEEALQFTKTLLRYNSGEKFNVLKELPTPIRNMAASMAQSNKPNDIAAAAKVIMQFMSKELRMDQEYIDLQEMLKKEISNIPEMGDMYADYLKEKMEDDLLKKADELEKSGDKDKAKLLRSISKTFTDTYKMTSLINAVENGQIKRLDKKIRKIDNLISSFNFKYKESRFVINDISLIIPVMMRTVGISLEEAQMIVACICEYTKNMSPEIPEEHTFMYYTIKNILSLDYITSHTEFQSELKNNIMKLVKTINEKGVKAIEK